MGTRRAAILAAIMTAALVPAVLLPAAASAAPPGDAPEPVAEVLATGLTGPIGSTIGPDGALYVADRAGGEVVRIDTATGASTPFATGLPVTAPGGVFDVAFIGDTAYVLISVVGPDVGGTDVGGIYRVDDVDTTTLIADIAEWSIDNPPDADYFVPSGVQYAFVPYGDGFLVTDGHHNRVLSVSLDGEVTELIAFGNIVPTGLAVQGNTVYMAEAGPLPHLPETGKVVSFSPKSPTATEVASGGRLLVDVEFGRGASLFALSQGVWVSGPAGSPSSPNTGALLEVNDDGTFAVVVDELNQPTSLEFIQNTAYVVTLGGEIWTIDNVSAPPHG